MSSTRDRKHLLQLYQGLRQRHSSGSLADNYHNRYTQVFRFKVLSEVADLYSRRDLTVLDFGCGQGELLDYLLCNGFRGQYRGVDIDKASIQVARKRFAKFSSRAEFSSIKTEKDLSKFQYDYGFVSGVFNDKVSNNWKYMTSIVQELFRYARAGVAFNATTTYVSRRDPHMAYYDPAKVLKFCLEKLSPFVALRHDYRRSSFSVFAYQDKFDLPF